MSIASKFTAGLLTVCAVTVSAAEEILLKIDKPEDFIQAKLVNASDNGSLVIKGRSTTLFSKEAITINPAKKYRLSGDFCLKGGKPVTLFLGFVPYDSKKRQITPNLVIGSNSTLTTVAEDAKKGDKVIKVKDASKWNTKSKYSYIAFNAAKDYSDLPNRSLIRTVVPNVKQNGDVWEVELKTPLKADVAAGTAVRQQFDGGSYIYTTGSFKTVGTWKTRSGIITGIAPNGGPGTKFWKGTTSVRVLILTLYGDKLSETEFRKVKVEEIK